MLCTKSVPPVDPQKCPCKSCKLRNVTSSEIEILKKENADAKKAEEAPEPAFPFGQHKKPLLILVVNKRKAKRGRKVSQTENADSPCYCGEPSCMSSQQESDQNNYNVERGQDYCLPSQSADALCYCNASDPIECDQDSIKDRIVAWVDHSETTLPASSTPLDTSGKEETDECQRGFGSRKFKLKRSDNKVVGSDQENADDDFRDRCRMHRMCGKPHPILIKKPTCNDQSKNGKQKGKSGVCDPFDSSDECDDASTDCSCWCDMERLEKTLKNIIPNEDCLCYCKKMASKTPVQIAAIARKERQKNYNLMKKKREREKKRKMKEEMLNIKYKRFPSVPQLELLPKPAHLDCCRWRSNNMNESVPLSSYSLDYTPKLCVRPVCRGWQNPM